MRALGSGALRAFRCRLQIVHQDPDSSLDPLMRIDRVLAAPLRLVLKMDRAACERRMFELLEEVGSTQPIGAPIRRSCRAASGSAWRSPGR